MGKQKRKKIDNTTRNAGLAGAATEVVDRYGSAVNEFLKGYRGETTATGTFAKGLKDIAKSKQSSYTNLKQQAGYAGEVLYERRTNAKNIINKSSERMTRTDALGDTNHQQFDFVKTDVNGNPVLDKHGNYTETSQMKIRGDYDKKQFIKKQQAKNPNKKTSKRAFTQDEISNIGAKKNVQQLLRKGEFEKYKHADYLDVPSEQFNHMKDYIKDETKKIQEQIKTLEEKGKTKALEAKKAELDRLESVDKRIRKSVSSKDAMNARVNPKWQTVKEVHRTANEAGIKQAKTGATIGAVVSLSQNIIVYASGEERDLKKLGMNVGKDVAGSATLSYGIGYSGSVISAAMKQSGNQLFKNLSKSNVPALIATSTWEVGKSIKKYLTDEEFDELHLIEELGEKGTGMMAASMGAAIGTAILPVFGTVAGAVIGGMAGYMTGSVIYNSAMGLLKDVNLYEENRKIVEQIAEESIKVMLKERAEFEQLVAENLSEKQHIFKKCFNNIDKAIETNNHEQFMEDLNELAITFGVELQFIDFDEFDDFMSDDSLTFKF